MRGLNCHGLRMESLLRQPLRKEISSNFHSPHRSPASYPHWWPFFLTHCFLSLSEDKAGKVPRVRRKMAVISVIGMSFLGLGFSVHFAHHTS